MTFITPQLAETHVRGTPLSKYDPAIWYAEAKYDGLRIGLRITPDQEPVAWSRLGNIKRMPSHIVEAAKCLPEGYYDGELWLLGGKSWDVTASKNSASLILVLFDMLEVLGQSICGLPQRDRNEYLVTATEQMHDRFSYSMVATPWIAGRVPERPSQEHYDAIIAEGGEGVMLKRYDAPYRPGMRSQAWLKVKEVVETKLVCIGFEEGTTQGVLSIARLALPNGKPTTVKARTEKDAREWTANPSAFVGRTMEVEAQLWTPDGMLRHPRMKRWVGQE